MAVAMAAPRIPSLVRFAVLGVARERTRSLLAVLGVAVAVAVLLALDGLNRGYRAALDEDIERLGFHVLVTAKGCPYETATLFLRGGRIPMYIDASLARDVAADPAVAALTPLFLQAVTDEETGRHQVYMGIEDAFFSMRPWLTLQRGRVFGEGERLAEAVVGYSVAEVLALELGDELPIPGSDRRARVVGVLDRTGTQDDGTVFLPLDYAQLVFDKQHSFTGLGVRLEDLTRLDGFIERVYELPGVQPITLAQVRGTVLDLVESARHYVRAVALVALVIAFGGIVNTMLLSVVQRTREFGVMRAMGASREDVFELVAAETVVLSLGGALLGVLLALAGRGLLEAWVRGVLPFAPRGPLLRIEPGVALGVLGAAAALGLVAALWPAWRACAVTPQRALRGLR